MPSSSTVTTSNLKLGAMRVTYNSVDLGGTKGGVSVSLQEKLSPMTVDQYGSTVVDYAKSGAEYKVKVALAEIGSIANLLVAFPNASLVTDSTTPSKKKLVFDWEIGQLQSSKAHALILHPLLLADADLSGDYKFPKAVAASAAEIKHGPEEQTVVEIEFLILPDSSGDLMIYGDPTATA